MGTKRGVVEAMDPKVTQKGKGFFRVNIGGTWYSLWSQPNFKVGDTIEFQELVQGNFQNMADTKVVQGGPEGNAPDSKVVSHSEQRGGKSSGSRYDDPEVQARIVRQNATSSAVALVAASKIAGKQDIESLLEVVKDTAKRLYAMNMLGYDYKAPSAPLANGEKEVGADTLFNS